MATVEPDNFDGGLGVDHYYGGDGPDFIDATDSDFGEDDVADFVSCGSGFDTLWVGPVGMVDADCEDINP